MPTPTRRLAARATAAATERQLPKRPKRPTTTLAGSRPGTASSCSSACRLTSTARRQSSAQVAQRAVWSTTSRSARGGSSPRTADQIVSGGGQLSGAGESSAGAVNASRNLASSWVSWFIVAPLFFLPRTDNRNQSASKDDSRTAPRSPEEACEWAASREERCRPAKPLTRERG